MIYKYENLFMKINTISSQIIEKVLEKNFSSII